MTKKNRMLPEDKNLPLAKLIDSQEILTLLNSSFSNSIMKEYTEVKIEHIRYSPKKSCQLSLRVKSGNKNECDTYYIRCMNDDIYLKVKQEFVGKSSCENFVLIDESNILICKFPADGKLKLSPLLQDVQNDSYETIRYKPETRFVATYKLLSYKSQSFKNVIARIELPDKVQNSYKKTMKVVEALKGHKTLFVPQVLHFSQEDSLLIQEKVDAISFADKLHNINNADLSVFANTISEFHSLKICDLENKAPLSFVNQFERSSKIITYGNVEIQKKINKIRIALMLKLQNLKNADNVVIHGDFHQGQVLIGESKNWIIDLDSIAIGSPIADLGNFYAQLKKLEFKSLVESSEKIFESFLLSYKNKTNIEIDNNELKFYTGCALVELTVKELRRLRKNWFVKVMQLLDESLIVLK